MCWRIRFAPEKFSARGTALACIEPLEHFTIWPLTLYCTSLDDRRLGTHHKFASTFKCAHSHSNNHSNAVRPPTIHTDHGPPTLIQGRDRSHNNSALPSTTLLATLATFQSARILRRSSRRHSRHSRLHFTFACANPPTKCANIHMADMHVVGVDRPADKRSAGRRAPESERRYEAGVQAHIPGYERCNQ